jgi:hypothetical protein
MKTPQHAFAGHVMVGQEARQRLDMDAGDAGVVQDRVGSLGAR